MFRKGEQCSRLLKHLGSCAGCILSHAIGNEIFYSNHYERVAACNTENPDTIPVCEAIHQGGADNLKAKTQRWMYPAARRFSAADRLDEAVLPQKGFEVLLCWGYNIEIAAGDCAPNVKFDGRAAYEDRRKATCGVHILTYRGEHIERRREFWSPAGHSAASPSSASSDAFDFRFAFGFGICIGAARDFFSSSGFR